tara:strand:+ start:90 stop:197 length:108 start_codon:yes stop_codon:yes gene_type:complete
MKVIAVVALIAAAMNGSVDAINLKVVEKIQQKAII